MTHVAIGGRQLAVSNLDKVLFPETGFTKGQLIDYYVKVAPVFLPHIQDRPLTMKRFPNGVDEKPFYQKHVPSHAPDWVRTVVVPAERGSAIEYVVVGDVATLAWAANLGAIEFHVPLWQIGRRRKLPGPPDQIVFDLDPGEGATIVECCKVATMIAAILGRQGMEARAKTSGSKGMQVYAALQGRATWDASRVEAHRIAQLLEHDHPDLVTSTMRKVLRRRKVLIDWSQNHRTKTTIGAYSVRGLSRPTVSTPVTWDEVARCEKRGDPATLEFTTSEVLARIKQLGDVFTPQATRAVTKSPDRSRRHASAARHPDTTTKRGQTSALGTYRSKRNPSKTPEPMGHERSRSPGQQPLFVIQEHHARALHWDFRLEHEGVLASWALPKGVPDDPRTNHLAIRTEDHPLDYETFEGEIPAGEYGGGTVEIWDRGTFELEKWRPTEVMVRLHGDRVSGRYVLFPTNGKNWMIHRMDPPRSDVDPVPKRVEPMLATLGDLPRDDGGWAYEIKWDGVRAIALIDGGRVRLQSRGGNDLAAAFPEIRQIGEFVGPRPCVLDGEIVVIGDDGKPDFGRLQHRLHLTSATAIHRQSVESPATYVVFDLLQFDGHLLFERPYDERREQLEGLHLSGASFITGESYRNVPGEVVLRATRDGGLEGVIAKRRDAPYRPGHRGGEWIKIKNQRMQDVVVGGWTEGKGSRAGSIGALLVGIPGPGGLRFVGKVGTGLSAEDRESLLKLLARSERKTNPFAPPTDIREPAPHHFVRPVHVGEVRFSEWTSSGRLRHPAWRGIRDDKKPRDVRLDE
ncbi:MAG: non-homologous end-joining DNA ligase [Acidimicrobiales bacterium]